MNDQFQVFHDIKLLNKLEYLYEEGCSKSMYPTAKENNYLNQLPFIANWVVRIQCCITVGHTQ